MKNKKGFTLIEMLVVVLIIGILAGVALPQYTKAVEKARATEAITNISSLEKAIDLWKLSNGTPTSAQWKLLEEGALDIDFPCLSFDSDHWCLTKNFRYWAECSTDGACEVGTYRINSNIYYPLVAWRDANGNWTRRCGYFDEPSKGVCQTLENQGWESAEGWDY